MKSKEKIIEEINRLKREKPPKWKSRATGLLRSLEMREDRFAGHEYRGNEFDGRKGLPMRSFEGLDYNDETVEAEEAYWHE